MQRLLAVLVASLNEPVTVERLCAAVWGETLPATYESGLRGHLSRARQLLGDTGVDFAIEAQRWGDEPAYCLTMSSTNVDHHLFSRLLTRVDVESDEVEHLEAALELWRGDAFAGIDVVDVAPRARQLEELRLVAAERLAVLYLARARSQDAISLLRPYHERQPDREGTTVLLARALFADGRQREALRVCRDAEMYLRGELGLEPTAGLIEVQRLILEQDESLRPRPAHLDPKYLDALLQHVGGPFVGREAIMSTLRELVDRASRDVGGTALVTGDVGAGKTRVLAEIAHHAQTNGAWCVHVAADGPSIEPFRFGRLLLRRLGASPSAMLSAAVDAARASFDEFGSSTDRPLVEEGLSLAIERLTDAIGSLPRPVILVLDDLQWIDSSSLAVVRQLAKRPGRRLGVVLAARSGSHSRSWDEFIADLPSTAVETLVVGPLGTTAIEEWLGELDAELGMPVETISALVERQTSGIAFLVAGVLDDLVAIRDPVETLQWFQDAHLPERLADPLRARIGRLDDRDIQLLAVAAVISPSPDPTEVASVCSSLFGLGGWDIDERRCLGLVRPNPARPGTLMFEHALTRAALQGLLSGEERRFAHRAAAYKRMRAGEQASAAAMHLVEAIPLVTPAVALDAIITAAQAAVAVFAFDEGAVLFQKALGVQAMHVPDDHDMELDLRIGLSRSMQQLGARRAALPYFEETLSRAEALGLSDKVFECALAAADFGEVLDNDDPVRHLLIRALEALPQDHPGRGFIAVEAVIKQTIVEGKSHVVQELFDRELGDVDDETLAHERTRAWLHLNAGSPNAAARRETASELQHATDDRTARLWLDATLFLLSAELELGNTDRAERILQQFRHAASQSGRPGVRWLASVAAADLAQLRGRLRQAHDLASRALDFGIEHSIPDATHSFVGHSLVASVLGGTLDDLQDIDPSRAPNSFDSAIRASGLALALAATGRHDEAFDALSDAVTTLREIPTSTLTPFSVGLCAEAWMRLDRPATLRSELLELVTPYSGTMWRMALVGSSLGPADRHLGALTASAGNEAGATSALDGAVELARRAGAPIWHLASAVERARHSRRPDDIAEVSRLARDPRVAEASTVVSHARAVVEGS